MRPTYSFPESVAEAIARDRYGHPDPRAQERMQVLWLKSKNEPHGRIAALAGVSRSTVQRALRTFAAKGLDGNGTSWSRNRCRGREIGARWRACGSSTGSNRRARWSPINRP